jgi:hypothetical protein
MKNKTPSPRKTYRIRTHRGSLLRRRVDVQNSPQKQISLGVGVVKNTLTCVPINESDRNKINMRMSQESIRISNMTKWSEKGVFPSFKDTDKILIEASRRAYKILGIST